MGLIEALIKELDHLPNAQAQIKVFTIVNGDATSLSNMLRQLLGQTAQQTGTQAFNQLFGQGALNPFLQPGLQSAAAMGESSLVPIRFGVDARTNSIIASGSEGDLGVVEAVLLRLDEDSFHKHKTTVYWLANAPAQSVATAVQQWLQNRITAYTQQMQLSPENPEVRYAQQVIVVPETISNTVIVSAVPSLFEEVKRVIEALDRRPPMIKIDVLIAEVTLTDNFEFGAEYGLQNSLLYDRTVTNAAGNKVGFNFNNKPLGDVGDSNKGVVAGQGLSSFGLGRTSPTLGYGGLVLSASSDAVSVLLRALQDKGRIQILSRPQITTLDSQAASVNIGQIVSRTRGSTTTQGVVTQNVEDVPTGILLGVTPRVTPDGLVVMELDAEKSQLSDTTSNIPNPGIGGGTVAIQNIDSTQASTTVSARSGQTVVFAGLIQSNKTSRRKGIPWLSDIPLVGPLFRVTTESDTRRELLIVMTPHVVRGDEDVDWIRQTESERMSWCLADVVDVYGDKSFGARPGCWCGADRGHCRCLRRARVVYPDQNPSGLETIPSPATVDSVPTPIEDQPVLAPPEQTSRRTFTEEASPQAAWAAPAGPALPYGPPRAPFVGPDRSYPGTPALYTGPSPSAFAAPAAYQGPVPPASVGGPRRLPVGDGNVASGGG
jgi:type II secretory pathway component GspD/PulD (secretin)